MTAERAETTEKEQGGIRGVYYNVILSDSLNGISSDSDASESEAKNLSARIVMAKV